MWQFSCDIDCREYDRYSPENYVRIKGRGVLSIAFPRGVCSSIKYCFFSAIVMLLSSPVHAALGDSINRLFTPKPKCTRAELTEALDAYFYALSIRDSSELPVTEDVKFTENGRILELGQGKLWPAAGDPKMRRDVLDTAQCAAVTMSVVPRDGRNAVLGLRIKLENDLISEIETLFVSPGFFFSSPLVLLNQYQPEWDEILPARERSTAVALRAYADSYFNALDTSGTRDYIPAPFAENCNRWENGVQTTFNNCEGQLRYMPFNVLQIGMTQRRFPVMDTEKGIAVGFASFTNIWNMMEIFLIRDARIQKIHAVMVPWTGQTGWETSAQ